MHERHSYHFGIKKKGNFLTKMTVYFQVTPVLTTHK